MKFFLYFITICSVIYADNSNVAENALGFSDEQYCVLQYMDNIEKHYFTKFSTELIDMSKFAEEYIQNKGFDAFQDRYIYLLKRCILWGCYSIERGYKISLVRQDNNDSIRKFYNNVVNSVFDKNGTCYGAVEYIANHGKIEEFTEAVREELVRLLELRGYEVILSYQNEGALKRLYAELI